MKKFLTYLLFTSLFFSACQKAILDDTNTTNNNHPNAEKIAPDNFNYATSRIVSFNIQLQTNVGKPVPYVLVRILNAGIIENYNLDSDSSKSFLFQGLTDENGVLKGQLQLDKNIDTVLIDPNYVGLPRNAKAYFINDVLTATLGGVNNLSGNIVNNTTAPLLKYAVNNSANRFLTEMAATWSQPTIQFYNSSATCNWNRDGVPLYLDPVSDEISAGVLAGMNASFPENGHVPYIHPEYFENTCPTDLNVTEDADMYIGFIYAGTKNQNSVGYYLYPTNNPPQKPSDITNIYYLFPNLSNPAYHNNQVILTPGNRVHIGTVKAGTSIGFFIVPLGWNYRQPTIPNTGSGIFFSNPNMNPENDPSVSGRKPVRHSVIINDKGFPHFVIGFEDSYNPNLAKTNSGNNDYNDAVIYALSTPTSAVDNSGVPPIAGAVDTDKDGVPDTYDDFPKDATRAFVKYFPSSTTNGYISFEDNWPSKGDYDMNDLVVQYQYKVVSNAQNNVVEMYANFTPIAAGASFQNGFGVQFPFASSKVAKVTGQVLSNNYIKLNANGTEAGQTNAVIIPFDNHTNLISNTNGAFFVNTLNSFPKVSGKTSSIYLSFTTPISMSEFGDAPFDMFAISNMRRGYEIHLPNYAPTNLVNKSFFGAADDGSNPSKGIYYVSYDNWPWAINFLEKYTYPNEYINVKDAYLHFLDWAGSGGKSFTDWYTNEGAGYRNGSNLYSK